MEIKIVVFCRLVLFYFTFELFYTRILHLLLTIPIRKKLKLRKIRQQTEESHAELQNAKKVLLERLHYTRYNTNKPKPYTESLMFENTQEWI